MRHSRQSGQEVAPRGVTVPSSPQERNARAYQGAPRHPGVTAPLGGVDELAGAAGATSRDTDSGPLVRPYTMTGGRTRSPGDTLNMISIIVATRESDDWGALEPEHATILRLCHSPISVAELSAQLDIPMAVIKVLLGDLITKGDVCAREPVPAADLPEMNILQAVLDGIRRL